MRWQFDPVGRLLLPPGQEGRVQLSNGLATRATLLQSRQHKIEPSQKTRNVDILMQ